MAIQDFQFIGWGFRVVLNPLEFPTELLFAFFDGKKDNFIVCKNTPYSDFDGDIRRIKDLSYFLRRRMEENLEIEVSGTGKNKYFNDIPSAKIIVYEDDKLYEMDEPRTPESIGFKPIQLDDFLNRVNEPEKASFFIQNKNEELNITRD